VCMAATRTVVLPPPFGSMMPQWMLGLVRCIEVVDVVEVGVDCGYDDGDLSPSPRSRHYTLNLECTILNP
jgi:hypothetical protein